MHILIRVDSSLLIGTGHVMRCLTLAISLRKKGVHVHFICRLHDGNLCDYIEQTGFNILRLRAPTSLSPATMLGVSWQNDVKEILDLPLIRTVKIDWLIVDHYSLDFAWENSMRQISNRIMVIDDVANRQHDCDLLLDQNLYENMTRRYDGLTPSPCLQLLGPKYALLRDEFSVERRKLCRMGGNIKQMLLFFGGVDLKNLTIFSLKAMAIINRPEIVVDVVIGKTNPYKKIIAELCGTMPNVQLHIQTEHMAQLMTRADLAIGAGGSVNWERCALGLPTIIISVAENQISLSENIDKSGIGIYLGLAETVSQEKLCNSIEYFLANPARLTEMSNKAYEYVDAMGAERVTNQLTNFH